MNITKSFYLLIALGIFIIIGAMLKIMHVPFANILLGIGVFGELVVLGYILYLAGQKKTGR